MSLPQRALKIDGWKMFFFFSPPPWGTRALFSGTFAVSFEECRYFLGVSPKRDYLETLQSGVQFQPPWAGLFFWWFGCTRGDFKHFFGIFTLIWGRLT